MLVAGLLAFGQLQVPAWVPPFAAEMKAAGILERYAPPRATITTRYEYAVMTNAAYEQVTELADATVSVKPNGKVETWWLKIDRLVDMVREFDRELRSLNAPDGKKMILRLRTAQGSLATIGAKAASDSPKWVEPMLTGMKKEGLLVGYPEGLFPRKQPTRYDYAAYAYATTRHASNILSYLLKDKNPDQLDVDAIQSWPGRMADLKVLFIEYRQELTAMGVGHGVGGFDDELAEIARLRTAYSALASRRFIDVHDDHWAAGAIREMSRNGLLRGYPNGKFGGSGK